MSASTDSTCVSVRPSVRSFVRSQPTNAPEAEVEEDGVHVGPRLQHVPVLQRLLISMDGWVGGGLCVSWLCVLIGGGIGWDGMGSARGPQEAREEEKEHEWPPMPLLFIPNGLCIYVYIYIYYTPRARPWGRAPALAPPPAAACGPPVWCECTRVRALG
jgi:hypothetical protein